MPRIHERICAALNELLLWTRSSRNNVQKHGNYTLAIHSVLLL